MAREFGRQQRRESLSEINVTPLIDLAFALLIIFMITAPLLEQTIELNLPAEAAKPQQPSSEDFAVLSIDAQGQIFWGELAVTLEQLRGQLESHAALPDPAPIRLRADAELRYQQVIDVIDLIKQQGLTRLSLDTQVGN